VKLAVDLEKCIVAGECYYNHPTLLKRNEETGSPDILVAELTTDDQIREAHEAAEVCPAQAISVID
jgi:ferredoxin